MNIQNNIFGQILKKSIKDNILVIVGCHVFTSGQGTRKKPMPNGFLFEIFDSTSIHTVPKNIWI